MLYYKFLNYFMPKNDLESPYLFFFFIYIFPNCIYDLYVIDMNMKISS